MKTLILSITAFVFAVLALPSCENEADSTTDAAISAAAPEARVAGGQIFEFTDNSSIGFIGSKITGSHEGGFKKFTGHFVVKNEQPQAGEFVIIMDSTWSDHEKLTGHLKAPDFFDVGKYPESTFKVTAFTRKSDQAYDLSGNLTLHGVTKNITFPTQVSISDETVKVLAKFDINRKDFGIVYPGRPDDLIRDEVIIQFDLEAKPKA